MKNMDILGIIEAADKIARRCVTICNTYHGSAWLTDKVIRFFESERCANAITFPVYINAPVMQNGEATIYRDGAFEMRIVHA